MQALADDFEALRRREFRRVLLASLVVHAVAVVVLGWTPMSAYSPSAAPEVIAVELVSLPPSAPAPAAAPRPPRRAPPPPKKTVVLPAKPSEPERVARKPKPKPKRRELTPDDLQRDEPARDYEDVLASLRAESDEPPPPTPPREAAPAPPRQAAPATGTPGSASGSDPHAAWKRAAMLHVRQAWVVPPGFRTQPLETHVRVRLDASGAVVGEPEIVRRSGNPWYDEGVVRGIQKAGPFPPPPEAGDWSFQFRPEDSY